MKIKLNKEVVKHLKQSSVVVTTKGRMFYYLPYWYEETDTPDVFDMHTLGSLPKSLTEALKELRESSESKKENAKRNTIRG